MKRISCPYLGLKDDPTTALGFPSPGNYCHQGRPIAPVKGAYQERYCLTTDHTACPIYQAAHPVPLPPAVAAKPGPVLNGRQVLALLGVPALIVAAAALYYAWSTFGDRLALFRQIPNTGPTIGDYSFQLLGGGKPVATLTPFSPQVAGSSAQTPTASCPRPANWVPYTVNPTDSLFRLSVIYGVSIEQLQQANCMGNKTLILPGQVIYIPFIPTDTPISTDTPVPQVVQPANPQPPALPAASATQTSAPEPKKPTKTAVPPTSTAAPTSTPVPPTPTTEPSVTSKSTDTAPAPTASPPTATKPPPTATTPPPPTATATRPPLPTSTSTPVPSPTTALDTPAATNPPPTPTPTATELASATPTGSATSTADSTAATTVTP